MRTFPTQDGVRFDGQQGLFWALLAVAAATALAFLMAFSGAPALATDAKKSARGYIEVEKWHTGRQFEYQNCARTCTLVASNRKQGNNYFLMFGAHAGLAKPGRLCECHLRRYDMFTTVTAYGDTRVRMACKFTGRAAIKGSHPGLGPVAVLRMEASLMKGDKTVKKVLCEVSQGPGNGTNVDTEAKGHEFCLKEGSYEFRAQIKVRAYAGPGPASVIDAQTSRRRFNGFFIVARGRCFHK